jgi:hypothetical protein
MNSSRAIFVSGAIALMSGASPVAIAQSQNASGIANNDSIFIDGRSLTISRGKSKGDSAAEIKRLGAKEMGPATLIIRSGDKLFVADLQPPGATTTSYNPSAVHALDPHRVTTGYNPSAVHAVDPHRVTGYNPSAVHAVDPHRGYNPSAVHAVDPSGVRILVNDPEYVHYKLKKAFEDNWTITGDPKQ